MAKFSHENSYFYMFLNEDFAVEFDFSTNMASGDSLSTATVSILDEDGVNQASTMITSISVSSPDVTFTVQNPTAVGIYEITIVGTTVNSKNHIGKIICDVYNSITLNEKLADPSANSYVSLKEANDYMKNIRGHPSKWDTLSIEGRKRVLIQACDDIDKLNFIGEKYYDAQRLEFPRDDHDVITGDVATPITRVSFKNTGFTSDTYGTYKFNTDYWKYGTIHITAATPLHDVRQISSNNITTDVVTVTASFSDTPTTNSDFIAFEPLDKSIKLAQCYQAISILENEGGGTLSNYKAAGASEVEIGDVRVKFESGVGGVDGMTRRLSPKAKQLLSQWIERQRKVLRA